MNRIRSGLGYGLAAYFIWGIFPFYFSLLDVIDPLEVVPWRVGSTLIFCAIVVTIVRGWSRIGTILRTPKLLGWFSLSALLLYINWQTFIVAVMTGHVIESALGYFINPIMTILLGVFFRKERMTRLQWIAVLVATIGVIIASVSYGAFPWIAILLAVTFALYGLVHNISGEHIDGVSGLTIETLIVVPLAAVQLWIIASISGLHAFSHGTVISGLLIFAGVLTAIPLIFFGESTRRLPLTYVGFIQFLTPILGFLYGVFFTDEVMSTGRWIGFLAVWIAIAFIVTDMIIQLRTKPEREVMPLTGPVPLD